MIKALDYELDNTEKKYTKLQTEMDSLKNENNYMKTKLSKYE
jgi:hypothetical protein